MMTAPDLAILPRMFRIVIPGLLLAGASPALAQASSPAARLQARYLSLQGQLSDNVFQRPLYLDSTETPEGLKGEIYAVIDHPYANVSPALREMEHWCDILILHLNIKNCRALSSATGRTLIVSLGRKFDEPLDQAYPVSFDYRVSVANDHYLRVLLLADTGPVGSRNYQIALEAVPLPGGRTFIHLSYSYDLGLTARLALKGYLATLGSDKVGFSVIAGKPGDEPALVDGVRGVVERNTMRYYLAIEAYLGSLAVPPADQLEKRLHDWFAATELFRRQLHEIEEGEYLAMKRKEVLRQQAAVDPKT